MERDLEQGPHGGPQDMQANGEQQEAPGLDERVKKYQRWISAAEDAKHKANRWASDGDKVMRGYSTSSDGDSSRSASDKASDTSNDIRAINWLRRKITSSVNQVYSRNPTFVASPKRPIMVPDEMAMQQMQQQESQQMQMAMAGQAPAPQGPPPSQQIAMGLMPPPMKDISEELAETVAQIMNNVFMESSLKAEAKCAVREAHHRPAAVLQVGYQFDENQNLDDLFFRRRSFNQFIIDPSAEIFDGEVRRCRFMGLKWELSKAEAEGLGLSWDALDDKENKTGHTSEERGYVYQIWDKQNNLVAWVPKTGEEFAMEPAPWPWEIDGFPFEIIKFTEDADQQWSKPLILEAAGIQEEREIIRGEITTNVTFARPATLYDSALMSSTEAEEMAGRGKDGWKGIKGLSQFPNAIQSINTDAMSPEIFNHYERCDAEMNEAIGSSSNAQLQSTRSTATESEIVNENVDSVVSEKVDIVTDALNRLGRKGVQIIRQTYTTPRVTQITGPDGAKTWMQWTGNVLSEVDLNIETGSIEREDTSTKRQVDLNMLKTMSPVPGLDILSLALRTLKNFGYKNPESLRLDGMGDVPTAPTLQPQGAGQGAAGGSGGNVREAVNQQANPRTGTSL